MMNNPFYFYTRLNLVELLANKARNVKELLKGIKEAPDASIYYHTHHFLQQHISLSPEPPNDFAFWTANSLGLDKLSERLASVDTVKFGRIKDLREKFLTTLEVYLNETPQQDVNCQEGEEFHFMSCKTYVLPTPYVANNLKEFIDIIQKVSINSIYFHIFEARLRLEREGNDFSLWFESIGEKELAKKLSRIDPYTITLEGLRKKILQLVGKNVKA
jgi:hypothetical protein